MCLEREFIEVVDQVDAAVLEVEMDLAGSMGIEVRVFEGVMNMLLSNVQTALDLVFMFSLIADEKMRTIWPLASAMVLGRKIESVEGKRLVIV